MLLRGHSHETKPQMNSAERSAKSLTETARIVVWNRNVSEPLPTRGTHPPTLNCNSGPIVRGNCDKSHRANVGRSKSPT
jgi:hypothetical protein